MGPLAFGLNAAALFEHTDIRCVLALEGKQLHYRFSSVFKNEETVFKRLR